MTPLRETETAQLVLPADRRCHTLDAPFVQSALPYRPQGATFTVPSGGHALRRQFATTAEKRRSDGRLRRMYAHDTLKHPCPIPTVLPAVYENTLASKSEVAMKLVAARFVTTLMTLLLTGASSARAP